MDPEIENKIKENLKVFSQKQISEFMNKNFLKLEKDAEFESFIKKIIENPDEDIFITEGHKLTGLISHFDIAKFLLYESKYFKKFSETLCEKIFSIDTIISKNIIFVSPKDKIEDCVNLLFQYHIHQVPVVEGGKIIGVIKIKDIANEIIKILYQEIKNAPQDKNNKR